MSILKNVLNVLTVDNHTNGGNVHVHFMKYLLLELPQGRYFYNKGEKNDPNCAIQEE